LNPDGVTKYIKGFSQSVEALFTGGKMPLSYFSFYFFKKKLILPNEFPVLLVLHRNNDFFGKIWNIELI